MRYLAIILCVFFVMVVSVSADPGVGGALKVGIDFAGNHEVSALGLSADTDVGSGIEFGGELYAQPNRNLDIGIGALYQLPREQSDFPGEFSFLPVYGVIRLKTDLQPVNPYIIGQLGYGFFSGDDDYAGPFELSGGLYWGGGAGVIIKDRFIVEGIYTQNNGEAEWMGITGDIVYSKFTLNLGINF